MKHTKRTVVAFLVALTVICTLSISLTACNHPLDSENRPFSMSISTPDGVFNPFFSTSDYDSSIISMTQIGMINTNENGQIVVGENEPTVAKDYTITENDDNTSTYEFLIKNGIKFSNGSALTIKDVLFNLYVYLDPVYTGAATIYSTDIVGLQQYRQQDLDAGSSSGTAAFEARFIADANKRIDLDIDYVKTRGTGINPGDRPTMPSNFDEERGILDFAYIGKTFYEELVSDWNAINVEDYKDWKFTEKWQVFFLNDGGDNSLLAREYEGGPYIKDEKGNYQLDKEYADRVYYASQIGPELVRKGLATESNGKFNVTGKKEDVDEAIKNYCIQAVFEAKFTQHFPMSVIKNTNSKLTLSKEEKAAVEDALDSVPVTEFETVAKYWGTAATILEKFKADAKTDYFKQSDKLVPTISGITTRTESKEFNGKTLDEKYDVLRITINGIDPKAIYNFGFTVAPMYYYSSTDWRGKNYIAAFDAEKGEFGLEFGNSDFMNEVINSPDKIKLPMGAGAYMASGVNGGVGTKDTFFNNNMVYYARNEFFYTTGKQIENAKIKYVRYKVVESDQIVNALSNGDIDFGDPSAKKSNQDLLDNKGLETVAINTNGYGYVGINPRFVPEVNVRRAIIKAFDAPSIIDDYYNGNFGSVLLRPMSLESWAYPKAATTYVSRSSRGIGTPGVYYDYDNSDTDIVDLLEDAGYEQNPNTGKYSKNIPGFGVDKLDYKFTIAGGSTDHPAYKMFLAAAEKLNRIGFDVKVVTSQQALSDLSAGKLAVWAAAWSSTIDPDMFQVYHMDSQASSVKNWGYSQILGQTNAAAWGDEYDLVVELSEIIDAARAINDNKPDGARARLYHEALDVIMELAVEFPIYQRKDLFAYQSNLLDPSTLPTKVTPFSGLLARIWEIDYIK